MPSVSAEQSLALIAEPLHFPKQADAWAGASTGLAIGIVFTEVKCSETE